MKTLPVGRGTYTPSIGSIVPIQVFGGISIGNTCGIIDILIIPGFLRNISLKVDIKAKRLLLSGNFKNQSLQVFQRKKHQQRQLSRLNRKRPKKL